METKHRINHTPATIYINYLVITAIILYAAFLVFYILAFKPELNMNSLSVMFMPVFLDWLIGLATIISFQIVTSLKLINDHQRLCPENVFFLIFVNTFIIIVMLLAYDIFLPDFFLPEALVLLIIPLLYLKNIWFVLQYNTSFLEKSFAISASGFLILLAVLSSIIILIDGFFTKNPVLGVLFDYVLFSSSVVYFIFAGIFSYAYIRKRGKLSL